MKDPRPLIGFDFDDVLFNFMPTLIGWHNTRYGTNHRYDDYSSFDLSHTWNCAGEEAVRRVLNFYESAQCKKATPVEGALELLRFKNRYRFVVITARPDLIEKQTRRWLDQHFPALFDTIIFANHFHGTTQKRTKSSICKELGVQLFIEDALHNAHDVASVGIPVLLFDAPWNREATSELITRVHSWKEIAEHLNAFN